VYDNLERRTKTKCHPKTVTRQVPVTKTSFVLSGVLRASVPNVSGAFAQASAVGARAYRLTS